MEVKIVSIYFLIFLRKFIKVLKIGFLIRVPIEFLLFEPRNGTYSSQAGLGGPL